MRVGVDLAKRVIQVHGVDAAGHVLTSRALVRDKFLAWCMQLPAGCIVAMETSSSAHHWARKLIALGLDARIIAAQLVSPYRRQGVSGKNDANDAAAICEAAGRPQMHFVPVKSIEQQSMLCVHRLREGFKADRTGSPASTASAASWRSSAWSSRKAPPRSNRCWPMCSKTPATR